MIAMLLTGVGLFCLIFEYLSPPSKFISSYVKNAKELLADSKEGKNPYDGFTPSVPTEEVLSFGDDNFIRIEEAGIKKAQDATFVLVAGALVNVLYIMELR
ncbi:hypothetical protein J1N35_041219 [Gossypium stocksii]|uniref:Uncharacterized protein n=1 Tax=Gossypium stocksii TaxID=47602 RepID=A0A9D3ZJ79_9ROSI|nr:hypothetical protein J1N35_041219 [Gossypium stocksii]